MLLLGAEVRGLEAVLGHGLVVRVLLDQVELGDELAQELARHHADVALEAR